MKKINKILFPTDFSDAALNAFRYALWFADQYEASIELLHVVFPEAEPLDFPVMVAQMTQQRVEVAKELVKVFVDNGLTQVQMAHQLEQIPTVNSDVEVGTPASVIADVAQRKGIDLIIMGTQGEHNIVDRAMGSVTSSTMAKAPCPVMAIPENIVLEQLQTVAYATDLAQADPYHIWETSKFLYPFHPILRVVHIEQGITESRPLDMDDLEAFFEDNAPALQITYHNIASKKVAEELAEFTETWSVDLLVMYRPKRGFFERFFHSSLIKKTTLHTKIPLLVLR